MRLWLSDAVAKRFEKLLARLMAPNRFESWAIGDRERGTFQHHQLPPLKITQGAGHRLPTRADAFGNLVVRQRGNDRRRLFGILHLRGTVQKEASQLFRRGSRQANDPQLVAGFAVESTKLRHYPSICFGGCGDKTQKGVAS